MSEQFCHSEKEAVATMLCPVLPLFQDQPARSMGRACMAWRWVKTHVHNPDNPDADLIKSNDTHGYCGLAGPWGRR